jgi:uncharacterized membrane protein YfcA
MNENLIIVILGLLTGSILGVTGFLPTSVILFILEYFNIGDYKSNLGTILFINLFPISGGSVLEFYNNKKINFTMGVILTLTIILASYISSKFAVGEGSMSVKTLKYITAIISLIMSILFFYTGYYEKN